MENNIEQYDIISFDMWDTLVSRPFVNPSDLWEYVGGLTYKGQRKNGFLQASEKEIETEIELAKPIQKVKKIYDEALRLGKQIIVVSDMYLSSAILTKILTKCGYKGFKLYNSCEQGTSKGTDLFKIVMEQNPGKIIHFDDAQYSINRARELGITAIKVNKVIDDLFSKYYRLRFINQDSLAIRHYLGWLAQQEIRPNYYRQLGLMLGVVGYGFAQYIYKIAKEHNIDTLLFLSRDMYVIHQFYNRLGESKKTNYYVFNSRKMKESGKNFNFYYNQFRHGVTAIVDTTTGRFSAQKLIKPDVQIYEALLKWDNNPIKNSTYTWAPKGQKIRPNPLLEQFWTEAVGSVVDIEADGTPIRHIEERDNDKIREMIEGQLEFKPTANLNFSFNDCKEIFTNFAKGINEEDEKYLQYIPMFEDSDHEKLRYILWNEEKGI